MDPERHSPEPIQSTRADFLKVEVYPDRRQMGLAAAREVLAYLESLQKIQDEVRVIVGSAPSQNEFFESLISESLSSTVDWSKAVVFHMDEYVGLPESHPQSFRTYQRKHFAGRIICKAFHQIHGEAGDPVDECRRLADLISEKPIDLVCCGIGENGHLAFNDPPVADFDDPELVKVVAMDAVCRQQQVNDGCFPGLDAVPTHAITLTLPVFANAAKLTCVVPAKTKATAVQSTVHGPVGTQCPATLMRRHADARLFLEPDSAALI